MDKKEKQNEFNKGMSWTKAENIENNRDIVPTVQRAKLTIRYQEWVAKRGKKLSCVEEVKQKKINNKKWSDCQRTDNEKVWVRPTELL